jgi:hypothetical protein
MSSNPGTYDYTIFIGSSFSRVLTLKVVGGDVVDLTGSTARLIAKPSATSQETILDLEVGSGITMGGTNGKITISLSKEETDLLKPMTLVYSLVLETGEVINPLLIGTLTISNRTLL